MTQTYLEDIRIELHTALEAGEIEYMNVLAKYWAPIVDVQHEPAIPADRPMDVDTMIAGRKLVQERFAAISEFSTTDIYSRVVANVIYLFCNYTGVYPDGTKMNTALCTRFTVEKSKFVKVILNVPQKS